MKAATMDDKALARCMRMALTEPKRSTWRGNGNPVLRVPYWVITEAQMRDIRKLARVFKQHLTFYENGEIAVSRFDTAQLRETVRIFDNPQDLAIALLAKYSELNPENTDVGSP